MGSRGADEPIRSREGGGPVSELEAEPGAQGRRSVRARCLEWARKWAGLCYTGCRVVWDLYRHGNGPGN